ncbi:MAG TPA: dockerin type I repeat-containing protein, partial [Ruminococcus sp.]|nr:dockerin type I repeat-containing protein [Ruminococcus sp.]
VAFAGANHGLFIISDKGNKVEQLDTVSYAKCVGYGAPEKKGSPNTLFLFGKPEQSDPEGIYRSTDSGKTWVCISSDHIYGGTGNGNYLVGDMDEFGKVYMSTVGCGIVYGQLASGGGTPSTDPTTKPGTKADWGDANVDKKVDLNDAVAILQYAALPAKYPLSEQGAINADVVDNGTSGITGIDALSIQMFDAKLFTQDAWPMTKSKMESFLK